MDVSETKRLKQLEDETPRLKKLPAEAMLETSALRELLSKNGRARREARRRRASTGCVGSVGTSGLQPSWRGSEDGPLPILSSSGGGAARPIARTANERRRFGYRLLFILLRREGEPSGVNFIHRLYREEGLSSARAAPGARRREPVRLSWWRPRRMVTVWSVGHTGHLRGFVWAKDAVEAGIPISVNPALVIR